MSYLWAMLMARIYETFPLMCPHCGAEIRIIVFITGTAAVRGILEYIGEPADAPRITRRGAGRRQGIRDGRMRPCGATPSAAL